MKESRTAARQMVCRCARMIAEVRNLIRREDVVETVVVNVLLLVVRDVGERPVVAGSDRRSAGLCRTKLKGRAGMAVVGGAAERCARWATRCS